jgi:hypothetical protein
MTNESLRTLADTITSLSNDECGQLKQMLAHDQASTAANAGVPVGPGHKPKLACDLRKLAGDGEYSYRFSNLSPEHRKLLNELLNASGEAEETEEPEQEPEQEQEPEYDQGEGYVGPRDLRGGGMPLPGGQQTPLKRGMAQNLAFDAAFPEVARIKVTPSYGEPLRRRREPQMSSRDIDDFKKMYPGEVRMSVVKLKPAPHTRDPERAAYAKALSAYQARGSSRLTNHWPRAIRSLPFSYSVDERRARAFVDAPCSRWWVSVGGILN